jgi:perosamine synthetase
MTIPQIQPWIDQDELQQLKRVIDSTYVTENAMTAEFEQIVREYTGARHAVAMFNGTVALYCVLRSLGIGPGDEVIVPDMTFIATSNSVILAGATPVFCDVVPGTLALDPVKAKALINTRTKAILPVQLYGLSADMDALRELCGEHHLLLVEDAAQGIGVRFRGRHVGTFGEAGILSFYGNKTITTGEGGVVLTDSEEIARACFRLKNHGRNQKGIFKHEEIGFNFSFTDLQAALGLSQFNKLSRIIAAKKHIREYYERRLGGIPHIEFQPVSPDTSPVYWFTNIYLDKVAELVAFLADRGIGTRRFFYPLHRQPCYAHLKSPSCPISLRSYETGLSLPSSAQLTDDELDYVCSAIEEFFA